MYISERCAECLYSKQEEASKDPSYLKEVRELLDARRETDTAPYMVYLFDQAYQKRFGEPADYSRIKKEFNDLALSMAADAERRIAQAPDPLAEAFVLARAGNYIDFGAMDNVDSDTFAGLFSNAKMSEMDRITLRSFREQCRNAQRFLLIADNCGEIVFDRLFLEQLHRECPHLQLYVMVRGGEVLNDVTAEDAAYVGMDKAAKIVSNGKAVAGTIYELLAPEAKEILDKADIVLCKGQGNYESLSRQGRHAFYAFLCKCDLFTERYQVPQFTGMFVEEGLEDV